MRVLVCGGRDFNNKDLVFNTLYDLVEKHDLKSEPDEYGNWLPTGLTIINGKARGADSLSTDWAVVNWVPFEEYPADWNNHGKSAGYIRNKLMLTKGKPDLVVAFPGGKGTSNMVKLAKDAGVEVIKIEL